ncbi:MAG: SOS response-associated peptidase, partial [Actinobacteria bacterium]|nr:SOS response-associated peptidase [Actinomycetota bacterium]
MCGRFVSTSTSLSIADFFSLDAVEEQLLEAGPRYNVAPTALVRVVLERGESRVLTACRWGLVPS